MESFSRIQIAAMPDLDPDLIGSLYDGALDSAEWEHALSSLCTFLNSVNVSIGSFEPRLRNMSLANTWGYDPHYLSTYRERLQKFSPLLVNGHGAPIGLAQSVRDVMPYEKFERSVFHQEWTKPQGHVDALRVNLARSETAVTFVLAGRHKRVGLVDDEMRRRMDALTPHLRRAVRIRDAIGRRSVEAAALADAADAIATAMLLVDDAGRIIRVNASAEALLAERTVIRQHSGHLNVIEPRADQALRDAIAAARAGNGAIGAKGIALSLAGPDTNAAAAQELWIADVLPLTAGARRSCEPSHGAVAAIFVRQVALDLSLPCAALATAFRLTSSELRVLMAVIEIGGLPKVADALGISETTAKTHLHHVFAKTGTNRQADLVRLVAGFASPLNGSKRTN
jgi:DNA-binding CsgD family transcriptional regulator/PAS domain-containing protein